MKTLYHKPYQALWLTIGLVLILTVIQVSINRDTAVDFHLPNTYIVVSFVQLAMITSLLLAIIGGVYWLVRNRQLVSWLTLLHVVLTILAIVWLVGSGLIFFEIIEPDPGIFQRVIRTRPALLLIVALSQFLLLLNVGFSLITNKRKE